MLAYLCLYILILYLVIWRYFKFNPCSPQVWEFYNSFNRASLVNKLDLWKTIFEQASSCCGNMMFFLQESSFSRTHQVAAGSRNKPCRQTENLTRGLRFSDESNSYTWNIEDSQEENITELRYMSHTAWLVNQMPFKAFTLSVIPSHSTHARKLLCKTCFAKVIEWLH